MGLCGLIIYQFDWVIVIVKRFLLFVVVVVFFGLFVCLFVLLFDGSKEK